MSYHKMTPAIQCSMISSVSLQGYLIWCLYGYVSLLTVLCYWLLNVIHVMVKEVN